MARKRPEALARKRSLYPTASLVPEPTARASRCGHSISTGATARNSGPGKSPLLPIPAWSIASSATVAAMRSPSSVEQNGSTGMKSTVPAIVVLRPSLAKRVMRWTPDSPAMSLAQLSVLPAPSEVIRPMPVTTTTGCPFLPDVMQTSSANRFDKRHALAAPVADGGHRDSSERAFILPFDSRGVHRREQLFASERDRGKRNVHGKLRLEPVSQQAARCPHPHARQRLEPRALLVRRRLRAGCTGDYGKVRRRPLWGEAVPHPPQCGCDRSGATRRPLREHARESPQRLGIARLRMPSRLQNQECAERAQHHALLTLPDWLEAPPPHVSARIIEQ